MNGSLFAVDAQKAALSGLDAPEQALAGPPEAAGAAVGVALGAELGAADPGTGDPATGVLVGAGVGVGIGVGVAIGVGGAVGAGVAVVWTTTSVGAAALHAVTAMRRAVAAAPSAKARILRKFTGSPWWFTLPPRLTVRRRRRKQPPADRLLGC